MAYSIIFPIYNEEKALPLLLNQLKTYSLENEILFIDDGSNDSSNQILTMCPYIRLITLKKNSGKGYAVIKGIRYAKYSKIIIMDGDLELKTDEIKNFMILNYKKKLYYAIGSRFDDINNINSIWSFGNYFLTKVFNVLFNCDLKDALCCAISFDKSRVDINKIRATGFDIDIDIKFLLIQTFGSNMKTIIKLKYNRRNIYQGKKLRITDGYYIIKRMLINRLLHTN